MGRLDTPPIHRLVERVLLATVPHCIGAADPSECAMHSVRFPWLINIGYMLLSDTGWFHCLADGVVEFLALRLWSCTFGGRPVDTSSLVIEIQSFLVFDLSQGDHPFNTHSVEVQQKVWVQLELPSQADLRLR